MLDLIRCCRRLCENLPQFVVAHEVRIVEVDLLDEFRRQAGVVIGGRCQTGREHRDQQRSHHRSADGRRKILRGAPDRTDITGQMLRRGRDQHIEHQSHQRTLPNAEDDEAENRRQSLPVVRHDERQPHERCGRQSEGEQRDRPW